jgi:hypothetical protein
MLLNQWPKQIQFEMRLGNNTLRLPIVCLTPGAVGSKNGRQGTTLGDYTFLHV